MDHEAVYLPVTAYQYDNSGTNALSQMFPSKDRAFPGSDKLAGRIPAGTVSE
ncbi:MAG: hypothetical protein ACLT6Y_09345 [Enterocloster sp.]|uniref:hypothetical protein n=1 Tax=Enterocloster sp. TaxID=2719315 RepID=UPI003993E31F